MTGTVSTQSCEECGGLLIRQADGLYRCPNCRDRVAVLEDGDGDAA